MNRAFLLIALLVIASCAKFHYEKKFHHRKNHKKDGFRQSLHKKLRKFTKQQFHTWQKWLLEDKKENKKTTHRHAEIARRVNKFQIVNPLEKSEIKPIVDHVGPSVQLKP